MDIRELSVDEIGLSVRSTNALRKEQIRTVGEMLQLTEEQLYAIRNLGKKSVEEILQRSREYRKLGETGWDLDVCKHLEVPASPDELEQRLESESGKTFVCSWLGDRPIDELDLLSPRAYNLLRLHGYDKLKQIIFLSWEELMEIPRMDSGSAEEIRRLCGRLLSEKKEELMLALSEYQVTTGNMSMTTYERLWKSEFREKILQYVRENDQSVMQLELPTRAANLLISNGYQKMSDMLFLKETDILSWKSAGVGSANAILKVIQEYVADKETMLNAVMDNDTSVLMSDAVISNMILQQYETVGFGGLSLQDFTERLPRQIGQDQLKKVIGSLLAAGKLEYVDFRCYRVYPSFAAYLERCQNIKERSKDMLRYRLAGETLEAIAQRYDLTRERVRQILRTAVTKIRKSIGVAANCHVFDEDYYRYFYETYAFDEQEISAWLGVSETVWNYLDLMEAKQGDMDLQSALEDRANLDVGLRLKIKNYLHRNKIYLDGIWIEKRRSALEDHVLKMLCRDETTLSDFAQLFNRFLGDHGIDFDENLYYTEGVLQGRKNRLCESRLVLWKQYERLRYYDIDSRDYTELFQALNLDTLENIEISTQKLMVDYPEVMEKYDIRDHYELHNLLRKTLPEGSFHGFHCCKMPEIRFGTFDRDSVLLDLLINNAPISQTDFVNLIHREYGYDPGTILGFYLTPLSVYYHQGMYIVDQKAMSLSSMRQLQEVLTDDFYYIDEIKRIYTTIIPGADPEEINPYNLKMMGMLVLSRYVVQHHASLEAYCRKLLTANDVTDLTPYRKRLTYVQMFSQTCRELKQELEIFEYEPNRIIHIRKMERAGVTKAAICAFSDAVDDCVETGTYFSIRSLRAGGFESELFDLGFSDWFYGNILASDARFSSCTAFGTVLLYKGKADISIQTFEISLIQQHGSIDVYDLMTELTEQYGCNPEHKSDVLDKLRHTEIYHDKYLDRLYANETLFEREIDDVEEI